MGRDLNSHANALEGLASIFKGEAGRTIAVELISVPSHEILQELVLASTELGPRWMDSIVNFIQHDKLPEDKRENQDKSSTVLDFTL